MEGTYYSKNKEYLLAQATLYNIQHKEQYLQYQKEYFQKNKDILREKRKAYWQKRHPPKPKKEKIEKPKREKKIKEPKVPRERKKREKKNRFLVDRNDVILIEPEPLPVIQNEEIKPLPLSFSLTFD